MGVRVDPLDEAPPAGGRRLTAEIRRAGVVAAGVPAYVLDGRWNDSFRAVNLLFDRGAAVRRVRNAAGDFVVTGPGDVLTRVARETGVDFAPLPRGKEPDAVEIRRLRTGMYQRYRGGNMDEGWTRLLLEQFGFPYRSVMDAEIRKGGLNDRYDVMILPDDSTAAITGEKSGDREAQADEEIPPEYRSGIGKEGVEALRIFVRKGGTLVTLGGASNFAIEKYGLSVRNVVAGKDAKEFWCPGSTLRVKFDLSHALARGMPAEGLVLYTGGPAFEIVPGRHNDRYETIARYVERDLLESGWLIGEQTLARKAGMLEARYGAGRVVLFGFRPQHRAQTHGTFKLLLNTLLR